MKRGKLAKEGRIKGKKYNTSQEIKVHLNMTWKTQLGLALTWQNSANWRLQLKGWWSSQEQESALSLVCPLSGGLADSGGLIRWDY